MTEPVKGSLFNIIVFGKKFDQLSGFGDFPCKVLKLIEAKQFEVQENQLTTVIKAPLEELYYASISRLVSDVPIFVLWGESPFTKNPLLENLLPYTTRLVFDSCCSDPKSAKKMLKFMEKHALEIVDINWAKLGGWRDLISRVFDTKEKVKQLMDTTLCTVTYRGGSISAAYLCGWLEAQVGLKGRVKIEQSATDSVPMDEIEKVTILFPNKESIIMKREPFSLMVKIHISDDQTCKIPYALPLIDFSTSLRFMKELFYYPFGEHYKNALRMIASRDS